MISIIIIVKNDPRIKNLVSALTRLTKPQKCEILVVDASEGTLDSIKITVPKIKWIRYHPHHKNRTFAHQRNVGITHAKGEIIVFIDADCMPEKNWLVELLKPILRGNEKIVSGACRPMHKNYVHKEEQYGMYRQECETMNIAISRDVIEKVGLFDESLEGCEDSDFCLRAGEQGFKIRHEKNAVVYHDWGGFKKDILRSFDGGRDRAVLYTKHRKHLLSFSINNIYTLFYCLYIICLPVAFFYPWYILIVFIPSVLKRRNPLKELFNLSYVLGFLKQSVQLILKIPVSRTKEST